MNKFKLLINSPRIIPHIIYVIQEQATYNKQGYFGQTTIQRNKTKGEFTVMAAMLYTYRRSRIQKSILYAHRFCWTHTQYFLAKNQFNETVSPYSRRILSYPQLLHYYKWCSPNRPQLHHLPLYMSKSTHYFTYSRLILRPISNKACGVK